jgi:acetyltransferase-like isoleucine patch superfamily enzyme
MLGYLWKNRLRPPFGSKIWLKQWVKRCWTLPSMLGFGWRGYCLKRRGAQIGEGSFVSPIRLGGKPRWLRVGSNSFIGRVDIQLQSQVDIGSNVCINDGVRLITASHDVKEPNWKSIARPIRINNYAWIATGAVVLPGITIGYGSVVGAFAVVAKDVPDYAVATGNPARIRENIRCHELNYSPTNFIAFQTAWLGIAPKK